MKCFVKIEFLMIVKMKIKKTLKSYCMGSKAILSKTFSNLNKL